MTFSKRLGAIVISLTLAACGGGGGGSGNSAAPGSTDSGTAKNQLFVGDEGNYALAAFTTLKPAANSSIAANVLDIGDLPMWLGIAYDGKQDRLYANGDKAINVFDKASALRSKIVPTRTITPLIGGLTLLKGMQLDKDRDILYVGYSNSSVINGIAVFNNASTLTGSVAPSRLINGVNAFYFVVDTSRNILYTKAGSSYEARVTAIPSQDSINGVAPFTNAKTMWLPFANIYGLALDQARDRLYVGVPRTFAAGGVAVNGGVGVVEAASTRGALSSQLTSNPNTPSALVTLENPGQINIGLAYDPNNDRLYAGMTNNVYILDSANLLKAGTPANALMITAPTKSTITSFAFP